MDWLVLLATAKLIKSLNVLFTSPARTNDNKLLKERRFRNSDGKDWEKRQFPFNAPPNDVKFV